jgi:DNA-binding NarL/FixJ family response regulator
MDEQRRVTVVIADDDELVRLGLRTLLQDEPGVAVIGEAATVAQAIALSARLIPRVVFLETKLPDGSGIHACREIVACVPEVHVIMITDRVDEAAVVAAVRAGAAGYLSKRSGAADIVRAIRVVAAGGSLLDGPTTRSLLEHIRRGGLESAKESALTRLERQVLALIAEGKTNKEIASALGVSEKTVKAHLSHAFGKLNVTRRAHAAVLFARDAAIGGDTAAPNGGVAAA